MFVLRGNARIILSSSAGARDPPRIIHRPRLDTPTVVTRSGRSFFPDEIVEGAEIEFLTLLHPCFGQKFCALEFADLGGWPDRGRLGT
jgi:hypothetical protein